jgi:3-hydroxyisobutyrate dehydrogenase-like beta-hydroxyacid dehydrogenase
VAAAVAQTGFAEVYVDANAVSPHTAERVAECVELAGARFVDGDVIGGPVAPGSGTRLYLSGPDAAEVAGLFAPDDPSVVVLGTDPTAASTLKMCYAAWTKGTSALVLAIAAVAEQAGLGAALAAEWARSQPDLARRLDAAAGAGRKAWRFAAEMDEIAATFAAGGLPPGFASAAADVYRRLERFKDAAPTPAELVDELLDGFPPPASS